MGINIENIIDNIPTGQIIRYALLGQYHLALVAFGCEMISILPSLLATYAISLLSPEFSLFVGAGTYLMFKPILSLQVRLRDSSRANRSN